MAEGLENLAKMEYPGRFIILGRHVEGEGNIAIYGVTGRSPPSQARKFVFDEGHQVLRTDVTDKAQLEKGSPALLIYPAMAKAENYMLVSNGAQTNHLFSKIQGIHSRVGLDPLMHRAFKATPDSEAFVYDPKEGWIDLTAFEPDAPNNTPRINGILELDDNKGCLGILKCVREHKMNAFESYEFEPGQGRLIATYTGVNQNPLPSFAGEPQEVALAGKTQEELAHAVYDALTPAEGGKDLRVAVACWNTAEESPYIINRHDLEEGE